LKQLLVYKWINFYILQTESQAGYNASNLYIGID